MTGRGDPSDVREPAVAPVARPSRSGVSKELRREAWRHFYLERRDDAVQRVGIDKRAIDAYIADLWKNMRSANRKEYVLNFANLQLQDEADNVPVDEHPRGQSPIPQNSPVTPSKERVVSNGVVEHSSPAIIPNSSGNAQPLRETPAPDLNPRDDDVTLSPKEITTVHTSPNCPAPCLSESVREATNTPSADNTQSNNDGTPEIQPDTLGCLKEADGVSAPKSDGPTAIANDKKLANSSEADENSPRHSSQPANIECLEVENPPKVSENPEWPRKLTSRLCKGAMLTAGKKILRVNDELILEAPQQVRVFTGSRGKRKRGGPAPPPPPSKIVRFSKGGREIGRLSPDIGHVLAPALQSNFVFATCRVVSAPAVARMFAEVILDLSIYMSKEAFDGGENEQVVEAGNDVDDDNGNAKTKGQGVDTKRISIIHLLSSLHLCERPEKADFKLPLSEKEKDGEPGAVSKEDAEAYYRTVAQIDEDDAKSFTPSKHLACTLREYQKVGVNWMISREKNGNMTRMKDPTSSGLVMNPLWKQREFPDGGTFYTNSSTGGLSLNPPTVTAGGPYGGILADEMGLGKTVQCIACIVHDVEEQRSLARPKDNPSKEDEPSVEEVALQSCDGTEEESEDAKNQTETQTQSPYQIGDVSDVGMVPFETEQSQKDIDIGMSDSEKKDADETSSDDVRVKPAPTRKGRKSGAVKKRISPTECSPESEKQSGSSEASQDDDKDDEDWVMSETPKIDKREETKERECSESSEDFEEVKRPQKKARGSVTKTPLKLGSKHKAKTSAMNVLMTSAYGQGVGKGGTLIVCHTSLVMQWMNELQTHVVGNFLRTVAHYGHSRGDEKSICGNVADVVITTYGVLASEFGGDSKGKGNTEAAVGGPIFKVNWRRVILDEAHVIRSRVTNWAKAAYSIKAQHRWCVTGTVINNHVNDVFSLLHFLKLSPWSSWAFWNRGVVANLESKDVNSQKAAMSLVRDIVSAITLRRKKTTKDSSGKVIVQLMKKTVEIVKLIPSAEERDFYSALHTRTKLKFDTFLAQGKVMNNFASVLELLLRLRQACDHPYLVFAAAPSKDSQLLKDKDKLYKTFMEGGSSSQYMATVLKQAESGSLGKDQDCPVCLDVIEDAVAPRECGHPACRNCLLAVLQRGGKCPICRVAISAGSITTLPRKSRFSVDLDSKWRSSAKIDALLSDLGERRQRRNDGKEGIGKSVVFSQFTSMLDLVEHALKKDGFPTLRIDGSVPQAKRADILQQFESEKELNIDCANVLLVSLRAGGVGLNLVAASHAVLLDIHWNPQVDAQAQDRIHRHGQTRDVVIKRYVIKDSVEERLLQVQARKQDIADGALGVASEDDKKQARLSELKLLFDGNP